MCQMLAHVPCPCTRARALLVKEFQLEFAASMVNAPVDQSLQIIPPYPIAPATGHGQHRGVLADVAQGAKRSPMN